MEPIIFLLLLIVVVGIVFWLVPIPEELKSILIKVIVVVVVISLVFWVLQMFGVNPRLHR